MYFRPAVRPARRVIIEMTDKTTTTEISVSTKKSFMHTKNLRSLGLIVVAFLASTGGLHAGEADLKIPGLEQVRFDGLNGMSGLTLMYLGIAMCAVGAIFGLVQYWQTKHLPVHESMSSVSHTIWGTCKEYLFQQGKFLAILWVLIAGCIFFYFRVLEHKDYGDITVILLASILGMLGSYGVAWFGIRINTTANSRTAFSALKGNPLRTLSIPLQSGMSVGLLLVSVELFFMISILVFLPKELVGPCFIGFAIGESLGASVLRICGGIFTKIADIGSDLMKIVFKLPEDDPKNPGVIADCTGDNAGDSVGPTADGFETYGVTGVALIAFLALALAANPSVCATLIIWLFTMRALMIATSLASYFINDSVCRARYGSQKDFDFEAPLTQLVWITSAISIFVTFVASYVLLAHQNGLHPDLWWVLAAIISCGTAAGALIPGILKNFHQHQLAARQRNHHLLQTRRRVAEHPVRLCRRQFFGVLDRAGHSLADVRELPVRHVSRLTHHGNDAEYVEVRRADFRLRPRRVRLFGHGAGDDCRGQLRPGHRQRAVHL